LCTPKLRLRLAVVTWIVKRGAIAQRGKRQQADIESNHSVRLWQRLRLIRDAEADIPLCVRYVAIALTLPCCIRL